mmetsp:Transcript_19665/g.57104  ORF Transcript_19665/g.57104 Transcript_19665/m.57104 type:complete len:220 (+) Transcript_19665:3-662(+)
MEVSMLTVLDFRICRPTAAHFLERYQLANGCSEAHRDVAQYLLELTLVEYRMVKYTPSHLAAAAVLLSNKLLRRHPAWPSALARHARVPEQAVKECAKEMCGLLELAESSPMQAVRKKYSALKHHAVAKLNFTAESPLCAALPPTAGAEDVLEAWARAAAQPTSSPSRGPAAASAGGLAPGPEPAGGSLAEAASAAMAEAGAAQAKEPGCKPMDTTVSV